MRRASRSGRCTGCLIATPAAAETRLWTCPPLLADPIRPASDGAEGARSDHGLPPLQLHLPLCRQMQVQHTHALCHYGLKTFIHRYLYCTLETHATFE